MTQVSSEQVLIIFATFFKSSFSVIKFLLVSEFKVNRTFKKMITLILIHYVMKNFLNMKFKNIYLNIWLILDFGMENFKNTLKNLIIINGLGALRMDK